MHLMHIACQIGGIRGLRALDFWILEFSGVRGGEPSPSGEAMSESSSKLGCVTLTARVLCVTGFGPALFWVVWGSVQGDCDIG